MAMSFILSALTEAGISNAVAAARNKVTANTPDIKTDRLGNICRMKVMRVT